MFCVTLKSVWPELPILILFTLCVEASFMDIQLLEHEAHATGTDLKPHTPFLIFTTGATINSGFTLF